MAQPSPLLPRLRRSILGAWLAVAYALAVFAAGLAPQPAFAHGSLDGALLCSGLLAPAADEAPPPPSGPGHCEGCPLSPVVAVPPAVAHPVITRLAVLVAPEPELQEGVALLPACAPPQSRAPPSA